MRGEEKGKCHLRRHLNVEREVLGGGSRQSQERARDILGDFCGLEGVSAVSRDVAFIGAGNHRGVSLKGII
jgi:hypothetical protein